MLLNTDKRSNILEFIGLLIALVIGLGARIWFITQYPVEQSSDFAALLSFAQALQHNLFASGWWWRFFSPGLPLFLSGLLNIFPHSDPMDIALWSTAIVTGLTPLVPYFAWKNVFPWSVRISTALLLGLWPSQIFFSNMLAQDNWVLLPGVILASLSIHAMAKPDRNFPIVGAIAYGTAVAMRQDMLLVLFPILISVIIGKNFSLSTGWRSGLKGLVTLSIIFVFLVIQRGIATGRYSLSSEHFGKTVAGAYIPGAGIDWVDPSNYIDSLYLYQPQTDKNDQLATEVALQEFVKRPGYHFIRMFASVFNYISNMETLLWWSMPGQPAATINALIAAHLYATHLLFIVSILVILQSWRNLEYMAYVVFSILLKLGLHAVTVSQSRYFLLVLSFEMLLIPFALYFLLKNRAFRIYSISLLGGAIILGGIKFAGDVSINYVNENKWGNTQTKEFSITPSEVNIHCRVKNANLMYFNNVLAAFKFKTSEPTPGEKASLICAAQSEEPHTIFLSIQDGYAGGGYPDRIAYVVTANKAQIIRHDLAAEPWAGWIDDIELGYVDSASPLSFSISITAINPDAGWQWGTASQLVVKIIVK